MAAIHIGNDHNIANSGLGSQTYLLIPTGAKANASGIINSPFAYWYNYQAGYSVYFGIFYLVSGTTYKCRSAANFPIGGTGARAYYANLSVVVGDFLGIYWAGGSSLGWSSAVSYPFLTYGGNACIVGNTTTFTTSSYSYDIRADGTGTTPAGLYLGGLPAAKRMRPLQAWFERLDGLVVPRGGVLVPQSLIKGGLN